MKNRLPRLVAVVCVTLAAASCGYALAGRGNALPADIKIIGVPQFQNQSPSPAIPEIDRILTEAVRTEFQSKGRYVVKPDDIGAHGVLTGTVISVALQPTAYTADRQASSYAIVVTASVEFKNTLDNNATLWSNPSFRVTDEYQATSSAEITDLTALFSQNQQAQERLAKKFARDIVTSIFEAF
jgi:hypothetical protein